MFRKQVLGNDLGKSINDRDLKGSAELATYLERSSSPRVVGSAYITTVGASYSDKFPGLLNGVSLDRETDANFIVAGGAIVHKDQFHVQFSLISPAICRTM